MTSAPNAWTKSSCGELHIRLRQKAVEPS